GGSSDSSSPAQDQAANLNLENVQKVLDSNADIALAIYNDSIATAENLRTALTTLRNAPSQANLNAARQAWLVAREPYGQTEVYRFRLSPIDSTDFASEDGPEGDINAWPLGEALIDYVILDNLDPTAGTDFGDDQIGVTEHDTGVNGNNPVNTSNHSGNNIIADTAVMIDGDLLARTATATDEHDVIAGYHAIEFLLWGQDLNNNRMVTNGTDRETAIKAFEAVTIANGGQRPLEDFVPGYNGDDVTYDSNVLPHRRHRYLQVAVDKLIADLEGVRDGWQENASYRTAFTRVEGQAEARLKLSQILTGMATLSEGELAGERMQIAYSTNSQEDEHSCFSDNTHRDIWLNAEGVSNSYYGTYAGYDSTLDGTDDMTSRAVDGYGLDKLLASEGLEALASQIEAALSNTEAGYMEIDRHARTLDMPVDVLIMNANRDENNPMFETIISLNTQSRLIATLAEQFSIDENVEDDDASSCDTSNPDTICE
ncbi:MAG: peptidase, imelysin family protein, partial [Gammaproteobacteria bacterium]